MSRPVRALAVVVAWAVIACVPASSPTPPRSVTPTSPAPSTAPTETPSDTVSSASPTSVLPPDASLAAEGGDPVLGQLGSYTWGDGGSDSPWLPGAPVTVGAGEPLSVTLADATAVASWTAVRAPAKAGTGAGAVDVGRGTGPIGFAISERGGWTVALTMRFVAGGTATWYWAVEVT